MTLEDYILRWYQEQSIRLAKVILALNDVTHGIESEISRENEITY